MNLKQLDTKSPFSVAQISAHNDLQFAQISSGEMTQQFDSGAMAYNHYQALGITRDATLEEIKKAYRGLARKFHPDVSKEIDAESTMQMINIAYDILSDALKKSAYDLSLDQSQQSTFFETHAQTSSPFTHVDHSDFVASAFHYSWKKHSWKQRTTHNRVIHGEDQFAKIELDLDVAYHGAVQNISVFIHTTNRFGEPEIQRKNLDIKIPKGLKQGQQIRLPQQGQAGINGGITGDLYLQVQYRESAQLRIEGADIYYRINISPREAALGQDIEVQTPKGKMQVTIPPNTLYGKKLRLKAKGIPARPAGHLYLVLNIVYPDVENEQHISAYQDFANAFSQFDPRSN